LKNGSRVVFYKPFTKPKAKSMKRILSAFVVLLVSFVLRAQESFPVNGAHDTRQGLYAFTNATIYVDHATKIENATLVIKDGLVVAAGTGLAVPKGAIVTDIKGKFIYPALVDPYTSMGIPEIRRGGGGFGSPQYESKKETAHGWNDAINSDYAAINEFKLSPKDAEAMRKLGFGAVLSFKPDGIVRGTSVFAALADGPIQEAVLNDRASAHYSFDKGASTQAYPNSIMGMVALLRQTYYDARWYRSASNDRQVNQSLAAFNSIQNLPQVFEANGGKLRVLLADKVGDEFGVQYIIKGNGDEYQRAPEIKKTGAALILPLNFPAAYDVEDPIKAIEVSLADMKHWELAPSNAKILNDQGIKFAFTSDGLKSKDDFWKNLREAVKAGLPKEAALRAVTSEPARFYNMDKHVGALKKGMKANFFIASGDVFDEDTKIHQTWVLGRKYEISELNPVDYAGKYDLNVGSKAFKLEISGKPGSQESKLVINDSTSLKVKLSAKENTVFMSYKEEKADGDVRLSGWVADKGFKGSGQEADGSMISWAAVKTGGLDPKEEKQTEKKADSPSEVGKLMYPFVSYGWTEKPKPESLLIKNATVWTLEKDGTIQADVLVQNGKIAAVGKGLNASGARVVDGTGKHLTPGIIDEHSHVALSGVNEGSQSNTAEVRMYDAVNSEDINIYRQLAGGVTAAQLLHGSANAVGGQSALVKFRWGSAPEEMKIEHADGFIKFALGENVKQANWGDNANIRFPQTRMGVEQVYMDGFTRAREYDAAWKKYNSLPAKEKASSVAPRKDLELEIMAEILNGKRFITCHSYVQSEINMLIKVAEQFKFKVNTFTHILEGYKVADKMAAHGVGGSTFADWWAYKMEVWEAIPYNAALMTQAGVVSAINSDDAEMARRLNQEAAKSVKYGNMSEEEALKLVTLNPAKLLHLDNRMGSIKVGKDADLVLWSDHPLSIYSKSELTMVDGIVYYSTEKDVEARKQIEAERFRLITKMRDAKNGGAKTQAPRRKEQQHFHCEDLHFEGITLTEEDHD
jgi:imidazolonepropionase-like amidohydrolase